MILTPDRLAEIVNRIEAGKTITQANIDRISLLQDLDLARVGREFLVEALSAQEAQDAALAARLGAQ